MKVGHRLSAIAAIVDHQPIAVLLQAQLRGDFGGLQQKMPEQRLVSRASLRDAGNGLFRHDERVNRRLRIDVAERQHDVVLVNNLRRNLARDDFFK